MKLNRWTCALLCAAWLTAGLAAADAGHDEAPKASATMDATAATAATAAATRSEAQTELFELVATAENGQLTVFLDRYSSNEPVAGAKVEVESGSWKAVATEAGAGSYRVQAPQFAQPGSYPLQFTVQAGADADLIETTLVVAEADAAAHPQGSRWIWWWGGGALAAVAALVALALWLKRRRAGRSGPSPQLGNLK